MTIVDLPTVARVRTALRATVTKHPDLYSSNASERLSTWLHTLEENPTVAPRLDPNSATSIPLAVRLTQRLADALDTEVNRLRAMHPGVTFTRSDIARAALLQRFCPETTASTTPPETLEMQAKAESVPTPQPSVTPTLQNLPTPSAEGISVPTDHPELRALLAKSIEGGKTTFNAVGKAVWNKDSIRRWAAGTTKTIPPETAEALRKHLNAL